MLSLLKRPVAVVCAAILVVIALLGALAPVIAPYPPGFVDLPFALTPPSPEHWFGADGAGRDVLSLLLHATGISMLGALLAAVVAIVIGVAAGLVAGYRGGRVDAVLDAVSTLTMSLPTVILMLAFVAIVGPGLIGTMILLGVLSSPMMFRLVRSAVKEVRSELYVDAARVSGLSTTRILRRHILSVIRAAIIVQAPIFVGASLLVQAALAFLGLSTPDQVQWGSMLNDAAGEVYRAPWLSIWPGAAISITVLALALLGHELRDHLEGPSGITHPEEGLHAVEHVDTITVPTANPTHEAAVLEVRGLSVEHRTAQGVVPVVRDVNLTVGRGQIVGIVGESGSGKTQTILAVLGLLGGTGRITDGEILLGDLDLATLGPAELNRVRGTRFGYVSQEPLANLDPSMRVGAQITEPMRIHRRLGRRAARTRALELLRRVGIADPERVFRSYPHEISGGMAQRVLIAAAVACDPELLIADEPTTALDVTVQAEVLDLLRSLCAERGMALLIVTHDLGVVADLCDRVAVMRGGRMLEDVPAELLFSKPATDYSVRLLSSASREGLQPPAPLEAGSPVVLRVDDLSVEFGGRRGAFRALESVSLELRRGETLGLVGESGSGKTTLGRAVLGLAPVGRDSAISLHGRRIERLSPRERREIAPELQAVFQDPYSSLNPSMSIGDILIEPLIAQRRHEQSSGSAAQATIDGLLDRVGLPANTGRRKARELSGGQRQRVAIARALALRPSVVICDEPVTALDATTQLQVMELLAELQRDLGVAYLFISHDLSAVERISHRVAVIHRGEIVETGTTDEVLRHPTSPYTERLLHAVLTPDPVEQRRRRLERASTRPRAGHPVDDPADSDAALSRRGG